MENKERGKKKGEKKERGSWKASFTTRKFRGGAYATVLSVIAIALVIAVNMLASKARSKLFKRVCPCLTI